MDSFRIVSIVVNLLLSSVLFMLLAYKYIRDKHRAALSWALTCLLLSIQVFARMLFAEGLTGEGLSLYVIILINCYMAFLILNFLLNQVVKD